jgi:hypothetical protein
VADVANNCQVVRHEEIGDAQFLLQVHQQVHHLRLHGHVQCGHGFVADDQFRVECQRARDAQPLALAAGKLIRVLGCRLGSQSNLGEKPLHALRALCLGIDAEVAQRLGHDVPGAEPRIERRVGVLEDDLHVAAVLAHGLLAQGGEFLSFQSDRPAGRFDQAQYCFGGGCLAAAGFAHKCQRLAFGYVEGHAVHGLYRAAAWARASGAG